MKKGLLVILSLSCFVSFSFAANRTDKYQAIKEGGDYYNQLQEIYQNEDYNRRHDNAVNKCKNNSQKPIYCLFGYNGDLHELGPTCGSPERIDEYCKNPSNGMTEKEFKIYEYVENGDTISTWAIMDNQCYQSMNGYYDEKEDKCLCEDGTHLENSICIKDIEETQDEEINQPEIIEEINEKIEIGKVENIEEIEEDNTKKDIPELNQAILWMYEKGLTIFNEPESFMASKGLRRDEATKFYVQYAKQVMGKTPDYSKQGCDFKDLDEAWSDLKDIIVESCQLGLFQGNKGKFMPTQQLTNAQAITVFMRLREGYKDETGSHFANNYYESAHAQGFLFDTPLDYRENFDIYTTRGDVAKMLFRGQKTN